jgi:hypothetical protein
MTMRYLKRMSVRGKVRPGEVAERIGLDRTHLKLVEEAAWLLRILLIVSSGA